MSRFSPYNMDAFTTIALFINGYIFVSKAVFALIEPALSVGVGFVFYLVFGLGWSFVLRLTQSEETCYLGGCSATAWRSWTTCLMCVIQCTMAAAIGHDAMQGRLLHNTMIPIMEGSFAIVLLLLLLVQVARVVCAEWKQRRREAQTQPKETQPEKTQPEKTQPEETQPEEGTDKAYTLTVTTVGCEV